MEKILEAMVDEITSRVLNKISENNGAMMDFLKVPLKAENIEGLDDLIEAKVEKAIENADLSNQIGEQVESCLRNASISIDI